MSLLDYKVSGITNDGFRAEIEGSILEPYVKEMWNAMSEMQFNAGQEREVAEVRDWVVKELESFLELVNIAILFDERKLKRVQWEKLGDEYCLEICRSLIPIIRKTLQDYQTFINNNKVLHLYEQDVAFVSRFLEEIPAWESMTIDEETGVITRESLETTAKTVGRVIRNLNAITGKDLTVGFLVSRFIKGGIPCSNRYYREIYDVLDRFGFIPEETKRAHLSQGSVYYRENYIKSFVFRDRKTR